MKYKLAINRKVKQYEYDYSSVCIKNIYYYGEIKSVVVNGYSIYEKYIGEVSETEYEYIKTDYSISVGNIVNGYEIKRIEVAEDEIILLTYDVITREIKGKSRKELEEDISNMILDEFYKKIRKYVYIDTILKLSKRISNKDFNFSTLDTYRLPDWMLIENKEYRQYVEKILSFDIDSITSIKLTPLDKYALNRMFENIHIQ